LTFILATAQEATAVTECFGPSKEDSLWATLDRIGINQLIGMVLLACLAAALAIVGIRCLRVIASAVRESRAYESRVLTSLYYNRVNEATYAAEWFPNSPVAAVVSASLEWRACHSDARVNSRGPANPAFHRALFTQTNRLKRSLWVLTAIGWSSTGLGLITSLLSADSYSTGPPIPLCLGLGIAIPAIWLHRGISSEADLLLFETDRMSLSLAGQIGEQLGGAFCDKHYDHSRTVQDAMNTGGHSGSNNPAV
jgi:hypothetical protein